YPFIACEVVACELWGVFESAFSNIEILVKFWEFLDRPPPLNPVQASYFGKVIGVFLMKKTGEMLNFIKSQPEVVPKLLLHMSTSSIMDLLLKIISMEESPEGKGTVQVHSIASQVLLDIIAISQSSHPEQPSIGTNVLIDELKSEVIVTQLVGFMLERDAPYSSSTLINGVTIFIELIRRNNSDYDVEPNATEPPREAVDLSDLLKVLASRIEDFRDLLVVPRSVTGPIDTSIGKQTPLGFERLKICEMFAELLHCSNMAVLNSHPIISVSADGTVRIPCVSSNSFHHDDSVEDLAMEPKVNGDHSPQGSTKAKDESKEGSTKDDPTDDATPRASPPLGPTSTLASSTIASSTIATLTSNSISDDVLIPVGDFLKLQFVDHRIIPTCFDLFFQFPWNNFLHTVVYDMVHQVFHRPMGDIGRPDKDGTYVPPKGDQGIKEGWNRRLTISIFKDGQLTKRITDAQRLCDYECAQPKGVRLGYMGHLTYIADETVRLLELYSQTSLLPMLYEFIDLEDWWNYVSKILKETKERDALVLGGTRPNVVESHKSGLEDPNDDYMDDNDEFGDENGFLGGDSGTGHEGDVASDQFARYLCQQITNNLPDKFGSSDEDEDEEEGNWNGEYGVDNATNGLGSFGNEHAQDFESDEDDDVVDEETWNGPWPATLGESKTPDSTSPSAALTDASQDVQDVSTGSEAPVSEGASNTSNNNHALSTADLDTTNATQPSTTPETSNLDVHVVTVPSSTTSTPTSLTDTKEQASNPNASTTTTTTTTTTPTPSDVDPEAKKGGDTTTPEPRLTVTEATAGSVAISSDDKKLEEVTGQVKDLDLEEKK
ncbi:hypothetical protein CPB97_000486, partial [Podila verticillata]